MCCTPFLNIRQFSSTKLWPLHTDVWVRTEKRHWNSNFWKNSTIKQSNLAQTVSLALYLCLIPFFFHGRMIGRSVNVTSSLAAIRPLNPEFIRIRVVQTGSNQMKWWKENKIISYKYERWNGRSQVLFLYRKIHFISCFIFGRSFNHSFIHSFIQFFLSLLKYKKETNIFFALFRIICHSL